ncbi:MAG: ATP-binding protein [Thermoflexaceae bacterium]|nr:ATP-binding protein [Thermoflexaceae bacterium]
MSPLLKRLKLGQTIPTLPDRLTLARAQQLDYRLPDAHPGRLVQRRDAQQLERRLLQAGFEERVTLDDFDWTTSIQLDRRHLNELFSLHFLQRKEHVLLIGPVGVGKTFLAQARRLRQRRGWPQRPLPAGRLPPPRTQPGRYQTTASKPPSVSTSPPTCLSSMTSASTGSPSSSPRTSTRSSSSVTVTPASSSPATAT